MHGTHYIHYSHAIATITSGCAVEWDTERLGLPATAIATFVLPHMDHYIASHVSLVYAGHVLIGIKGSKLFISPVSCNIVETW